MPAQTLSLLNPALTFDTFLSGGGYGLAYESAIAFVSNPSSASALNPLFLAGGNRQERLHLLNAIGNYATSNSLRVACSLTSDFTREFYDLVRKGRLRQFRQKYTSVDFFLLGEVDGLGGEERVQEEAVYLFNTLFDARKRMVFTSEQRPDEIAGLNEELASRFEWGKVVDLA